MYLTQAVHELSLKEGPGRAVSGGGGCSTLIFEFLGNFERALRDFSLFFSST